MRFQWPVLPRRWRRHLVELVVVALGVMMGLAATETVKAYSDAREVRAIRAALDQELSHGYFAIELRHQVNPCVERYVRELQAWLDLPADRRAPLPETIPAIIGVGVLRNIWEVAAGNGSAAKMPVSDLVRYASLYGALENFERIRTREGEMWLEVVELGGRQALDEREVALLKGRLSRTLRRQQLMDRNRTMIASRFQSLGIQPVPVDGNTDAFRPTCEPLFP